MSDLSRLLEPHSVAIAGLSADERKHGGRVLANLRRFGYDGAVWGVNPGCPSVEGVAMYASMEDLPRPPDLVVAAVPARAALDVVAACAGVGAVIVFAGGFAESGPAGRSLQEELAGTASSVETRLLGPNSGGVIRPAHALTASFLTCLDRPPGQIRSGPIAVVTQSGGMGSYLHNLSASRGEGLAVSVSTGNEADIDLGEAIEVVSRLDEVRVVLAIVETVRAGRRFMAAVRSAHARGKQVVACRIGVGERSRDLMASHTGALAVPEEILEGVLQSLGVVIAETPAEGYEVARIIAQEGPARGPRVGIVTHSGGAAILLADLAERHGVDLPTPSEDLSERIAPLLDHGVASNPLDMGGIIGGPGRFAEVVDEFGRSGEFDVVLAVSTPHPPAHTAQRVGSLLALDLDVPLVHLWMAGDQAAEGLDSLRKGEAAVTEEPRAASRALAALAGPPAGVESRGAEVSGGTPEDWGIPLLEGIVATSTGETADAADEVGYPVVVKLEAPGLAHKTELGGVKVDIRTREEAERAFAEVTGSAAGAGLSVAGARIQRYRPGVELIIGAISNHTLGPLVSVGIGGTLTEVIRDVVFAPAPIDDKSARALIDRLRGRQLLDGFRGRPPADVDELARIISALSLGVAGSDLAEVEINPLIWDGEAWIAVDWLVVSQG